MYWNSSHHFNIWCPTRERRQNCILMGETFIVVQSPPPIQSSGEMVFCYKPSGEYYMNNENKKWMNLFFFFFFRGVAKRLQQRIDTQEWFSVAHQLTSIIIVTCIARVVRKKFCFNGHRNTMDNNFN